MFDAARQVIDHAIAARVFPAASIEVGGAMRSHWREAFGRLTYDGNAPAARHDTIFDLASLTKVLATTPIVMQQIERGVLGLDDPVGRHVAEWRGGDRSEVTIRDLLAHCSGLPGYVPLFQHYQGRAQFEPVICATPLEYTPRAQSIYSDLGFMLLGFIAEDSVGLSARFDATLRQMGIVDDIQFNPPPVWRARTAPTEYDPWRGRQLVGEVHDENAAALGGVAGHAGLFGTAAAVGACARHLLQILQGRKGAFDRDLLLAFISRRDDVPGSSRALGWDTMLPTSSCGTRMSRRAFGHTGFTGTSLWIDPDRDVYVVLLTNRVYPTREGEGIKAVRMAVHDAVLARLDI